MPATPMIDAVDVIRMVGPQAFGRARDIVRAGLVDAVVFDLDDLTLTGTVQGSDPEPYSCSIRLREARPEFVHPGSSTCTCPIGGDCKHVAATLLALNARALADRAAAPSDTAAPVVDAGPPDWRLGLSRLAGPDPEGAGSGSTSHTPMGLQFELRDAVPARLRRIAERRAGGLRANSFIAGGGPGQTTNETASNTEPIRPVRLGVRPVTRSSAGNWVRGQLTWTSLPYSANRIGADPAQHAWFLQFHALHRAGQLAGIPGESDWLHLDDFTSGVLWPLLAEASRLGITLVAGKDSSAVTITDDARVVLDAVRAESGDLTISAGAVVDGRSIAPGRSGVVGTHGLYAFRESPSVRITLGPSATPVTDDLRRMLVDGERIVVPAADAAEFVSDWSPRVRGAVDLVSTDGSVALPERTPPTLVLTVTYTAAAGKRDDRAHLAWRWDVDGRTLPVTMHAPLPDLAAEFAVLPHTPSVPTSTTERARLTTGAASDPSSVHARGAGADARGDHVDDAGGGAGADAPPGRGGVSDDGGEFVDGPGGALDWFEDGTIEGADVAAFTAEVLPVLRALDGIRVTVIGEERTYTKLTDRPELSITTVESEKTDWFDLGILVTVQGRRVPFAPLLTAIGKRDRRMKLIDGSYLSLVDPVFDRLKELVEEARELTEWEPGDPLRISPYQAGLWSEFDLLADASELDETWRAISSRLLNAAPPADLPVPPSIAAELRPYQRQGYAWLSFLMDHGLGGVLADDMGLGKTLQTLAAIQRQRSRGGAAPGSGSGSAAPFLVVAPTSVVGNWAAEAARFAPGLRVATITTTSVKHPGLVAEAAAGADIVVTSYALFRLDAALYRTQEWSGLVLDEAQFVKNPQSIAHRAALDLPAPVKIAITGTPLENGLGDLWALFRIVAPGLLSSWTRFTDEYVKLLSSPDLTPAQRSVLTERLRTRVRPLMLRRTKQAVAADLPDKVEQVVSVTLDPAHRELYETTLNRERLKLLDLVDDLDQHRMIVFRSLTLLRMLALSPALVSPADAQVPSAKLDLLVDEIEQLHAEGRRALVFSQFTSFLGLVADRLDEAGVAYEYLDGSTRKRDDVISRFRSGDAPAFLISLKAGGFGLTLTEADTVFVLDPWWNPAAENQAIDRTHRIGQTRSVSVQRFIAADTIEEKVLALAGRKAELFDAMIDDDDLFAGELSADDIRGLLA